MPKQGMRSGKITITITQEEDGMFLYYGTYDEVYFSPPTQADRSATYGQAKLDASAEIRKLITDPVHVDFILIDSNGEQAIHEKDHHVCLQACQGGCRCGDA